jgi:hypothetical protein
MTCGRRSLMQKRFSRLKSSSRVMRAVWATVDYADNAPSRFVMSPNRNTASVGDGASTPAMLLAFGLRYRRGDSHRRDGVSRKRQKDDRLVLPQDDLSFAHGTEHPAVEHLSGSQADCAVRRLIEEYADWADLAGNRTDKQKRRSLGLGRLRLQRRRRWCRGYGDNWRRGRAPRGQKKRPILRRRQFPDRYRPQRIVDARLIGGTGFVRLASIRRETCRCRVGFGVGLPDYRQGDAGNAAECRQNQ